ncbi:MAG: hypothetical protein SCK57_06080 [Bacillota bacterium]|nr:hypothetical protein [Bacillota bacterium]MDW7677212.1 hypothetical protein [Bacillota bacterium]
MSSHNQLKMLVDHSLCCRCEARTSFSKQMYEAFPYLFRNKINKHFTGAIHFGRLSELIDNANQQRENLNAQEYLSIIMHGVTGFSGQSVLTLLNESAQVYALPVSSDVSRLLQLWNALPIGPLVLMAMGVVVGMNSLHSRRYEKKAKAVRKKRHDAPSCYNIPGQDEDDDLEVIEQHRDGKKEKTQEKE